MCESVACRCENICSGNLSVLTDVSRLVWTPPVRPLLLFSFSLVRLIRPRVYWRALAPLHLWLGLIQPQISSLLSFDLGRFIQIINKIMFIIFIIYNSLNIIFIIFLKFDQSNTLPSMVSWAWSVPFYIWSPSELCPQFMVDKLNNSKL